MQGIKDFVRRIMTWIARGLNNLTRGKVKPSHITAVSLLGHIPVAWALVNCRPVLAALLLAFFALLDALDGALARVQGSSSRTGMFFDSVSDRLKEVLVFSALAVYVYKHVDIALTWQVAAAAGTSVIVSFVRARGEAALAGTNKQPKRLNSVFAGGISSYENRVVALVVALLFGWLEFVLPLLIAANLFTIAMRFIIVAKELYELDQKELAKKKANQKKA